MGKFLTAKSRLGQTNIEGIWYTQDNQLYKDDDGVIYLAPRHTLTDGYTIPEIFTSIVGGKLKHDVRCSTQHDFECYYHKVLRLKITEFQLRRLRLLHFQNNMWICENIPVELLDIKDTTFKETNKRFVRMLRSINNISGFTAWLIGQAVNFNVGWLREPKKLHLDRLYRIDYEQIK